MKKMVKEALLAAQYVYNPKIAVWLGLEGASEIIQLQPFDPGRVVSY